VERRLEALAMPLDAYAAGALSRRLQPITEPGEDIAALPAETLHTIRLHGKRLRYAAEFFAPLFPGRGARRFIRRVAMLQERLGYLNDAATATGLITQLGLANGSRNYSAGVVRGFVAARANGTRGKVERAWRKFLKLEPFWTQT
jgi:CHAD domain-containing protein